MNKELINSSAATAFIIVVIGSKAFLGYPRLVTDWGLTAGWLIVIFSGLLTLFFWQIIIKILACFPGKSITEITQIVCGPFWGLGINLAVFSYSILETSIFLRLFSEATNLSILTETPVKVIALIFILVAWLAVHYGIEVVCHAALFSYVILSVVVALVLIALYPCYDFKLLFPLAGAGVGPLIINSFWGITGFAEVVMLAYLVPHFSFDLQRLKKVGNFGISFLLFFFTAITIIYLMTFPVPINSEALVPFYQLSRSIFLGHYFQRVEAFFLIFWDFTGFLRIAGGLLVGSIILRDTLKLPIYRPLFPLLCLIIFSLAFLLHNMMEVVQFEGEIRLRYGWLVIFGIPFFVGLLALLLRKKDGAADVS